MNIEVQKYLRDYLKSFITKGHKRVYVSLFVNFLKKEDILNDFIYERGKRCNTIGVVVHTKCDDPYRFVREAFDWSLTELGYTFWQLTDSLWQQYLLRYHINIHDYLRHLKYEQSGTFI